MVLAIVGPTGIGKSQVAVAVAREVPAEVVAVDSMQVYRGMDRGTGKPDLAVRKKIPHHGIDLVDPEEEFNAAQYLRTILPILEQIRKRGQLPILVGGTGLYLKVLRDGLCPAPGKDLAVRERLLTQSREEGTEVLHARLSQVDPKAAERIHPNDLRRIVRALEVYEMTGQPLSQWHRETVSSLNGKETFQVFGLTMDRSALYRRIDERVNRWLASGWLQEAQVLHQRRLSLTAKEALGYRELFDFLEGKTDWPTTVSLIQRNSRRYAKRQWAWFKRDPRIRWIDVEGKMPEEVARRIVEGVMESHGTGTPH